MSNSHNLQGVIIEIEMTSYSHHVTQTKLENRQTMETKGTCFCEESFIDRCLPWLYKPKKPMVNRV